MEWGFGLLLENLNILEIKNSNMEQAVWCVFLFDSSYNTLKTFMQDGDSKVDLGARKHTLAASGAGESRVPDGR